MKKGDPLVYSRLGREDDGWSRFESEGLFEFSAPPHAELIPMRCGDSALNWKGAGLTLRLVVRNPGELSGLALPYIADMYFHDRKCNSVESLVSDFASKLLQQGTNHVTEWIDGIAGRVPVVSCLRDAYSLEISNFFVHGGCWELTHGIGCERPTIHWPEVAKRIASSIRFVCNECDCRKLVYME